jgi:hypothetical protein
MWPPRVGADVGHRDRRPEGMPALPAGSGPVGGCWLGGREVAVGVAERPEGEGEGEQGDQGADDAADQGDAAGALHRPAAGQGPDQASTPAMLMTRPSRWLGTICWRRLAVLR